MRAPPPKQDISRPQYNLLAKLGGQTEIHGWRTNSAMPYRYAVNGTDELEDYVTVSMLTLLVAAGYLKGRVFGPGMSPPLRFSITPKGKEIVGTGGRSLRAKRPRAQ